MPTDIIEMWWGCRICDGENRGRHKVCQNCGKPRGPDSPEWMPDDISPMAAVRDAKLLGKFRSGPDWKCGFCQSSQFRADGNCAQCGAEQARSVDAKSAIRGRSTRRQRVQGGTVAETVVTPRESIAPATKPDAPPTTRSILVTATSAQKTRAGIVAALVGVVVLVLYLVLRTHVVDAHVQDVRWGRAVAVERYKIRVREGWVTEPGAFDIVDTGRRVHHYDHVRVGSHQESYQEDYACGQDCRTIRGSCYTTSRSCTSNGNGSATCTGGDRVCEPDTQSCSTRYCTRTAYRTVDDYEDQPAYQEWYRYSVWAWEFERSAVTAGKTDPPTWPTDQAVNLCGAFTAGSASCQKGEQERQGARTETYAVTFVEDGGTKSYTYEPKTESEFVGLHVGDAHKIRVGIAHGVEVLP